MKIEDDIDFTRVIDLIPIQKVLEETSYAEDTILNDIDEDIEIIKEFIKTHDIKCDRTFDPVIVYCSVHAIIKYIEWKKRFNINKDLFREQILNSYNMFSVLNRYEKNRGNSKLSKRCELLLKQFDKYIDGDSLNNNLEQFFDVEVGTRLPSIENVLTIFKNILKRRIENIADIENYIDILIEELFNLKRFRSDLRYHYIQVGGCKIAYSYPFNKKYQKESKNFIS